jgi:drug/metabolite transporter (DMT)-like permease
MSVPSASVSALRTEEPGGVLRGLAFVLIAMMVLPGQDTIAKYLSATISPGQITWARFFMQSLFTLPFLLYFQGIEGLMPKRLWPNVVRGALIAGSSISFFAAIKFMPIADALAIFFIEPFILTILSAAIDGEQVGWRRRTAVATGFIGVLIVVQPSWNVFGSISLIPAFGGGLFAVYALLNRRLTAHDTPLTMQFTAGVSAVLVLTLVLGVGWGAGVPDLMPSPVGMREVSFLAFMGVFGTFGHLFFVHAARLAPSSLIAPMQYVEIVFAALFGYAVFGDFPTLLKWVGIVIIVGSGAYVFWRESRVSEAPAPETEPSTP